jgi:hypothetical protein
MRGGGVYIVRKEIRVTHGDVAVRQMIAGEFTAHA